MKNKVVGAINILVGTFLLLFFIFFFFSVFPQLNGLYKDLGVGNSAHISMQIVLGVILLGFSLGNLFLGVKNFTKTKKTDDYFIYGIVCAGLTLFASSLIVGFMVATVILLIYNLSSVIE